MIDWAPAGDFESVLTYGIGIGWPIKDSNPQFRVRVIEVEQIDANGQPRYIVAIDIDATQPERWRNPGEWRVFRWAVRSRTIMA